MTKKKVILLAAAALFAVSGLTALPSGNITGGVGCIVVAAVCAYFGLKKKSAGKENGNRTPAPAAASGGRILDTIRTKVVGVTFNNEDGENRQDILSRMSKKPLNTVFQDICKHEVLGDFFTDKSFNLENPQKVS